MMEKPSTPILSRREQILDPLSVTSSLLVQELELTKDSLKKSQARESLLELRNCDLEAENAQLKAELRRLRSVPFAAG